MTNHTTNGTHQDQAGMGRRTLLTGGLAGGLLILGGGAVWLGRALPLVRASVPAMGTVAEVLLPAPSARGEKLARAALDEIRDVEARMTRFDPASEIGRVNGEPGRAFAVSPMTAHVVRTALEIARVSGGSFDPALGRLGAIWGFYERRPPARLPDARELAPAAGRSLFGQVELGGGERRPRLRVSGPDAQLDLGGIAKGYAVDRAVALLRRHGVNHALVNVGGDLYALGRHPEGRPWQVGVRHPRDKGRFLEVLSIEDGAVATSGDYENFFMAGGRRYHHLLDPRTGRPAPFHQSVTVTAPSVMTADALATATSTSSPPQARGLLRRLAPGRWMTVDQTGAVFRSGEPQASVAADV